MKKVNLFSMLIVAVVMLVGLTNCKKDLKDTTPVSKQYVDAVAASFNVIPGIDITTKDLTPPVILAGQTMSMYTSNTIFYPSANPFALVRGLEFIQGSLGWNYWQNTANNPASFPTIYQGLIYSNLTPDENVRVVIEGNDVTLGGHVAYIGITDFNPSVSNFPLPIKEYRLGDVLTLNADALRALPSANLTITANFDLAPVDLNATKMCTLLDGHNLSFADIKFGPVEHRTVVIGSGDFELYSGMDYKVIGTINITIVENWIGLGDNGVPESATITVPAINATASGHGMHLKLSTDKIGWFDSAIMNITSQDIDVTTTEIVIH